MGQELKVFSPVTTIYMTPEPYKVFKSPIMRSNVFSKGCALFWGLTVYWYNPGMFCKQNKEKLTFLG